MPTRDLRLLDLTVVMQEDGVSEFTSLDMAVHMLFLAGNHSYEITRRIAHAAQVAGFDGLAYPSYFSLLRTGAMPFQTVLGMSLRRISAARDFEKSKIIGNLALFGRPIEHALVSVRCINRLILTHVAYNFPFCPWVANASMIRRAPSVSRPSFPTAFSCHRD